MLFGQPKLARNPLFSSKLFDEKTFYHTFLKDLSSCLSEVIIESPYLTSERMKVFTPIFKKLVNRKVKVYIITRDPKTHDNKLAVQSEIEIRKFEEIGVQALICIGNHHRKLAIIDRTILWEGSLNILSQTRSREIMRRIVSHELSMHMFNFLELQRFI